MARCGAPSPLTAGSSGGFARRAGTGVRAAKAEGEGEGDEGGIMLFIYLHLPLQGGKHHEANAKVSKSMCQFFFWQKEEPFTFYGGK